MLIQIIPQEQIVDLQKKRNIHKLYWDKKLGCYIVSNYKIKRTEIKEENSLYFCLYYCNYIIKNNEEIIEFKMDYKRDSERKFHETYLKFNDYNKTVKFLML